MNHWQQLAQRTLVVFLCLVLVWATGGSAWAKAGPEAAALAEVAAPVAIEDLKGWFDRYEPRLQILSPRPNETLETTTVTVALQVEGLNIFQDPRTGLGPHVEVVLDDLPSRSVYDLKAPVEFTDLQPGTHLLRAFVVYPWGESIKSPLAYAEQTFHLYTRTAEPPTTPLLTYNQPQGTYGAEPVLLDFYLSHVPVGTDPPNWQVRCTINGQSFTVNRWQPYYLTGFKPGENWVRLDLLDDKGQPLGNPPITRLVTYRPGGNDPLSRLLRGELAAKNLQSSLSPSLPAALPPAPSPAPSVTPAPEETPAPGAAPESAESPAPATAATPAAPEPATPATAAEPAAPETPPPTATAEPATAPEPSTPAASETPAPTATTEPAATPETPPRKPFWQRFGLAKRPKDAKSTGSVLVAPRPPAPTPEPTPEPAQTP